MIEVHAAGLGKLVHFTEKKPEVKKTDPDFTKRIIEDAIARGWLLKTTESHLLVCSLISNCQRHFGKCSPNAI